MAAQNQPLDITANPELSRLADEVQATQRPQTWRRAGNDVAMLVPVIKGDLTPMPHNPALEAVLKGPPKASVIARTAGILHTDQPFPGYEEEEEQAAIAIAADIVAKKECAWLSRSLAVWRW